MGRSKQSRKAEPFNVGQVYVYPRGNVYQAKFTTPEGRQRRSLQTPYREIAEGKARVIDDAMSQGDYEVLDGRQRNRNMTFAQLAEEFTRNWQGWSEGTWRSTGPTVRKLSEEFGDLLLSKITARSIDGYLARRADEGRLEASHNRTRSCLSTMFACAVRWGYIRHNPVDSVRMLREQEKEPRPYDEDELNRLMVELPINAREVAEVALDTGMRKGELGSLLWDHVSFERGMVHVVGTKTKKVREIPMTQRVREILTGLDSDNRAGPVVSLQVFGTRAVQLLKAVQKAGHRAHVEGANVHRFRDTFCTRLADRGVPIDRIQKLAGHTDIRMTLRYTKTREAGLREAIATLEAV